MIIQFINMNDFEKRVMVAGFSQRSFAKHIGVSIPYMNQIFNGKRSPSAKIAKKMCDGLEIEFDEIFFVNVDNKSYQTA